jgi:hypothetical protein
MANRRVFLAMTASHLNVEFLPTWKGSSIYTPVKLKSSETQ